MTIGASRRSHFLMEFLSRVDRAGAECTTARPDAGAGGYSEYATVVISAFAAWRESRRVCCTTIGTSDSIRLA